MSSWIYFRRFFISLCAFIGAAYFADLTYGIVSSPLLSLGSDFWVIVISALVLAVVFTAASARSSDTTDDAL